VLLEGLTGTLAEISLRPSGEIGGPSESNNIQDEMAAMAQMVAGKYEKLIFVNPHCGFAGFACG
jgi:hypothetical protein